MRVALIEPYFGGSHRAFAEGYARASAHDIELFTHAASFWKWRMQGAHLTLAEDFTASVVREGAFDALVTTSMLDTARFLGQVGSLRGDAPVLVYMHENQLTYPTAPRDEFDMTYAMTNWSSMAAANETVFNSEFHKREWFTALPAFLRRLPDHRHERLVASVESSAAVIGVGVDLVRLDRLDAMRRDRPLVLWNHRWEHDKGPDRFTTAVLAATDAGAEFDVALAGEQFVSDPTGFEDLKDRLGDRIVHYGEADDATYRSLLVSADVVVSTARQEFFGVSITEAVYAGAFPLLPNALVYPERIPEVHHDDCLYDGHDDLVARLTWAVAHRDEAASVAAALRPVMAKFDWGHIAPLLDAELEKLSRGE